MRAVVIDRYGDLDVLEPRDLPEPVRGPGEILIRIAAVGVNPADGKWRSGMFASMVPLVFPHILGYDVAGTVEESDDPELPVGARVAAILDPVRKGGYAELVATARVNVGRLPDGLDFAVAAAVPTPGLTGAQMVEEHLDVRAGDRVLVTGAAGFVGRFAIRAAKVRGAQVVAAVRRGQESRARHYGADTVVVLGAEPPEALGFDHVVDTVGGDEVAALCRLLTKGGRIRTAATTPIPAAGLLDEPQFCAVHPDPRRLEELLADVAAARVPVEVERRLPLEEAAAAQRLVDAGGRSGKVVLIP